MINKSTYSLLDNPLVYKLSQLVFAPGANKKLVSVFKDLSKKFETTGKIIDIGCGPSSWLWKIGASPVGLDISYEYSSAYSANGSPAVTGSAFSLPFATNTFDGVWCVGVLHHLPDDCARATIREMLRICRPGGYIVLLDAVLPESTLKRPIASLIRRMDRGRFMRSHNKLNSLLPSEITWATRRYTYATTGLEMFECSTKKSKSE